MRNLIISSNSEEVRTCFVIQPLWLLFGMKPRLSLHKLHSLNRVRDLMLSFGSIFGPCLRIPSGSCLLVTTSVALVTTSVALVSNSFLLLLVRHLLLLLQQCESS